MKVALPKKPSGRADRSPGAGDSLQELQPLAHLCGPGRGPGNPGPLRLQRRGGPGDPPSRPGPRGGRLPGPLPALLPAGAEPPRGGGGPFPRGGARPFLGPLYHPAGPGPGGGLPRAPFPRTRGPSEAFPLQALLSSGDLLRLLTQVRYAASNEEYRAIFRGVQLEFSQGGLRAVASDGYRLALSELSKPQPFAKKAVSPPGAPMRWSGS